MLLKKLSEAAKVTIRNARRDGNKEIEKLEKDGDLTEDQARKGKDDVQELTKQYEKKADEILEAKTKEVQEL